MNITPRFGCGTGVFYLDSEKKLFWACQLHDLEYDQQFTQCTSRWEVDRWFLQRMKRLAKGNLRVLFRSYVYRVIVVLFGWYFWKRAAVYDSKYFVEYNWLVDSLIV